MTCMAGRIWHGKDAAVHVEARSETDSGKCTAGTFVGARDMAQQGGCLMILQIVLLRHDPFREIEC